MPGVASNGGRDLHVSLDSYCPPQAGQPLVSKVLSHHSLLSSLGAWRLGEHPTSRSSTTAPGNNKRKTLKKNIKKETSSKTGMLECLDNDAQPFSRPPGHQQCQENSCHQWRAQENECWHCHPAGNMASQCRHIEVEGLHILLAREEFWWT